MTLRRRSTPWPIIGEPFEELCIDFVVFCASSLCGASAASIHSMIVVHGAHTRVAGDGHSAGIARGPQATKYRMTGAVTSMTTNSTTCTTMKENAVGHGHREDAVRCTDYGGEISTTQNSMATRWSLL